MNIGAYELILIFLIVIVIFGPSQVPRLMRMLGDSMKEFRNAMGEDNNEREAQLSTDPNGDEITSETGRVED